MMTVNEVSKLTGVSIRTLQYYDKIGLLHPAKYTEAGYRLYDDAALETLQQILLFRELEFPLKEIKDILDRPGFDPVAALEQQIKDSGKDKYIEEEARQQLRMVKPGETVYIVPNQGSNE